MLISTILDDRESKDSWYVDIEVDREKLIDYFCDGRHMASMFRKAQREGSAQGTRMRGGVRYTITFINKKPKRKKGA